MPASDAGEEKKEDADYQSDNKHRETLSNQIVARVILL